MAEFEFAGMTFKGGKMFAILTALSTLGGATWAGFEVYKDYMDMKEIVQNIDVDSIAAENDKLTLRMDEQMLRIEEAIEYTRDIKSGLRDDILAIEKAVDRVEDQLRESEVETRQIVQNAEERFENKRDSLQNDYDEKANALRDSNSARMTDLEGKVDRDLNAMQAKVDRDLKSLEGSVDRDVETLKSTVDTDIEALRARMERLMAELDERLKTKLQRALDNPLSN